MKPARARSVWASWVNFRLYFDSPGYCINENSLPRCLWKMLAQKLKKKKKKKFFRLLKKKKDWTHLTKFWWNFETRIWYL